MTADSYFVPARYPNEVSALDGGKRAWVRGENPDGVAYAAPLFDPVEGFSPSGTDYRALGGSRHSKDVAVMQTSLLAS